MLRFYAFRYALYNTEKMWKENKTQKEKAVARKLAPAGVLRKQWIKKKHQFNFTQTYSNMGCVNILMLDFEIALNVCTIQIRSHGASGDTLYIVRVCVCIYVPQGMTVPPDGDKEVWLTSLTTYCWRLIIEGTRAYCINNHVCVGHNVPRTPAPIQPNLGCNSLL